MTAVAGQVRALWREVLDRDDLDPSADWFALGGDSVRAVQLLVRIAETYGVELDLERLYEHATVHDLAGEIVRERRTL